MSEKPILFSGPMVRALLAGRKTQTRRLMKPQPQLIDGKTWVWPCDGIDGCKWSWGVNVQPGNEPANQHSRYKVGDVLWVRETFSPIPAAKPSGYFTDPKWINRECWYAADNDKPMWGGKWKPSIFMPRKFSRISLEVTSVKCEQVQAITEEDAIAEGAQCAGFPASLTNRGAFAKLWEQINGKESWDANVFVWKIAFKRILDAQQTTHYRS